VAGGHPQDFVATLSDALTGAHLSILYRQVRGPCSLRERQGPAVTLYVWANPGQRRAE
jgi:hypothetical protein